ncbi:MAG: hypothetical protein DRJ15_12605 [Bacteroidetes bacterium]|nr:MAG: hypothetical protein DRJ15_12605 [Bacteroidota bacterium]
MKLEEICLTESVSLDSAIRQLISVASSLASHTNENKTVFKNAASNAENNQVQVLRRSGKKKTREASPSARAKSQISLRNNRWFTEHFKSSKRSMSGLQTALEAIASSNLPPNIKSKAKSIASIQTSAYNAQGRANAESKALSGTKNYDSLLDALPVLLDALASSQKDETQNSLKAKATSIRSATKSYDAVVNGTTSAEENYGKEEQKQKKKQKDKNIGQQNSTANNTASQLINELVPKDKRAAVRAAVERSDNKLQTLKSELDKLGIKENVELLISTLLG